MPVVGDGDGDVAVVDGDDVEAQSGEMEPSSDVGPRRGPWGTSSHCSPSDPPPGVERHDVDDYLRLRPRPKSMWMSCTYFFVYTRQSGLSSSRIFSLFFFQDKMGSRRLCFPLGRTNNPCNLDVSPAQSNICVNPIKYLYNNLNNLAS